MEIGPGRLMMLAVMAAAMISPTYARAAGNDVTLTTDAVVQAGGYDFDVSGSSAAVQSITVNAGDFTVTLASGSSITISQPGLYEITNDVDSDVTASVCSTATSSLTLAYSGAGTVTNTISASSTSCSTATPGAPSSVSATAGNGQATVSFTVPSQGGSPITSYTVTSSPGGLTASGSASPITISGLSNGTAYTFTVLATNQSGNGPSSSASSPVTPSAPVTGGGGGGGGGGSALPPTALAALLAPSASTTAYLNSVATSSVPGCPAGYTCSPNPLNPSPASQNPTAAVSAFVRDLKEGSTGQDVKALQEWLNSHGYIVSASGAGSPGHETDYFGAATKEAVAAFQRAKGISPAVGYFGPLTRAALNAIGGSVQQDNSQAQTPAANAQTPSSVVFDRDLTMGSIGPDVKALQEYLNAKGYILASAGSPGSPGHETETFGPATRSALVSFQKDNGISPAVGYFGPVTRAFVNSH